MANIKDVAQAAGVSPITVSRVFNHPELVSPKTIDAVRQACDDLSYSPNLLARGLVTNKTNTIGVFFTRLENALYTACLSGITEKAAAMGYNVLIAFSDKVDEAINSINILLNKQIDGLILMGVDFRTSDDNGMSYTQLEDINQFYRQFNQIAEKCYEKNFPIVCISQLDNAALSDTIGLVAHNYAEGTHLAVKHLVQNGHTNIGFLAHIETERGIWGERYRAFFQATEQLHCTVRPEWISLSTDTADGGFVSMSNLLRQKELPTAVYCANDEIAVGAINACHAHQVRVPEDISIIGHDGSSIGLLSFPKLTTISTRYKDMGVQCVNTLFDLMNDSQFISTTKIIHPVLSERDSVKLLRD